MKRRTFMKVAGATSVGPFLGATTPSKAVAAVESAGPRPAIEDGRPRIDADQLNIRNDNRSTVCSRNGMVCASQPLATLAAVDILRDRERGIPRYQAFRKLIGAENPKKPLSDSKIADLIAEEGISVARRTVAKYREAMKITSSSERKIRKPR